MVTEEKIFSLEQLHDFARYCKVQHSGKYNMFDPRARQQTGLTKERYLFVIENYNDLAKAEEESQ